uniref:DNA mismatch repair protein Msh6 n=1 Tax=Lygus hesperus TaxID=30085 RepID=A0A146MAE1_LYGHE
MGFTKKYAHSSQEHCLFTKDGTEKEEERSSSGVGEEAKKRILTNIVFSYQPVQGVTPSSFGVEVAKMAGLPLHVLTEASQRSTHAEVLHKQQRTLHDIKAFLSV